MIEAVKFWNEPNNKSHWDLELDPEWSAFARMVIEASAAVRAENPSLVQVLGGMSPIDAAFMQRLARFGVLDGLDVVAEALVVADDLGCHRLGGSHERGSGDPGW